MMQTYLKTKDYSVTGEEFELLYDAKSEMLITNPQPENLESYYKSEDYISHSDAKKSISDKIYQFVKRFTLFTKVKMIEQYAQDDRSILDVGAGTGDFLFAASQRGWTISGVEPNHFARKKASEKTISLEKDLEAVSNRKFKVITLWHVLEHLPDLENQILALMELMEERGTLIIAVPNYNSYDAKHYREFWAAYDVPRHLWHFSKSAMKKLFANYGMQVVDTRPMVFDAFYVSLLSEKYRTGKANYFKAFFRGMCSNVSAWRTKEYSSLIYVLQKA